MQAIVFEQFGPATVLKQADVPTPGAGAGEVLIKLSHTSVNPVDWKIRAGYLVDMLPHRFPIIPGWDAAGVVAAVGSGVTGLKAGDEVYAYARLPEVHSGTYAEYIALPATYVAKKPRTLDPGQAAAVPLVALTAWQALHQVARVKAGDKVLITGGAGGVGSFAVQMASLAGAEVTATAGAANQAYLRELGAAHTVDYTKESLGAAGARLAPAGYDVVFDAVGGESLKEASSLAKAEGRIVSIVETPARGDFHFVYPDGAQLAEIARLLDQGSLQVPAIEIRSVREAAAAQEENARRHVRGKVVLRIDF